MADDVSLTRLIIAVHLSRVGTQQLLLKLDSGTNGPILYDPRRHLAAGLFVTTPCAPIAQMERSGYSASCHSGRRTQHSLPDGTCDHVRRSGLPI
jgi:hypothetical protein